ncbi:MAG: carbohydrate kinase family protein [bacterium]
MYDVITFGAGSQDIYIKSKKFAVLGGNICVPIGSKTEAEDILFFSGGGGTNAAATFANQGFKVAYCGKVGQDYFGGLAIKDLKARKIDVGFVLRAKEKATNVSFFLTYPEKDRTILVYRGASDLLYEKDIPWTKIKQAKWFYLAPFSGKLADLTEGLVDFAKKNKIKVAFNPGYDQLNFSKPLLTRILKKVDVLILNQKEAAKLTDKLDGMAWGIVVTTRGGQGAVVSDGKYLYQAKSLGLKLVDATGAGDSFGSGFVSGLIQKDDIIYAIQLAMANSGYNITKWGAKEGLLKKGQNWPKVKVLKENRR